MTYTLLKIINEVMETDFEDPRIAEVFFSEVSEKTIQLTNGCRWHRRNYPEEHFDSLDEYE